MSSVETYANTVAAQTLRALLEQDSPYHNSFGVFRFDGAYQMPRDKTMYQRKVPNNTLSMLLEDTKAMQMDDL